MQRFNLLRHLLISLMLLTAMSAVHADESSLYDQYPYAAAYYYGITGRDALGSILIGQFHRWPEHIQAVDISKTLDKDNWFRKLLHPLTNVVQIAANVAVRDGSNQNRPIYEFNPYFLGRWSNFPWNHYINTSLALGEGVSYATSLPSKESWSSNHSKRFLNFLMLEATLASPKHPNLQLILRIHHRSGAYGLYGAGNTGSNALSLGLRYMFD